MAIEAEPYLDNPYAFGETSWALNGGLDVVRQYSSRDKLLSHLQYFRTTPVAVPLPLTHNDKPIIVSHTCIDGWEACCNRSINDFDNFSSLFHVVWNRNEPSIKAASFNIFGHTPTDYVTGKSHEPILTNRYCNIDTGCPYSSPKRGYLTAVLLPSFEFIQVPRDES